MSRKHYVAIARSIREVYDKTDNEDVRAAIAEITSKIASDLKADNSRFDRTKFYNAAIGT